MFFNFKVVAAFAASMAMASALPQDNRNYEVVTNALGYTTTRFKPGMGPGSEDYIRRFGNVSAIPPSENSLFARQDDGRTTSPFIGDTRIPYGMALHTAVSSQLRADTDHRLQHRHRQLRPLQALRRLL
jgi:hypothetical protein